MSAEVRITLYSTAALRAFATFCNTLAADHDKQPKDAYTKYGAAGIEALVAQAAVPPATAPVDEAPAVVQPVVETPKRGRKTRIEELLPNIQAQPENRVDPAAQAQDVADEQAEKVPSKTFTHDDVRGAMTDYLKKFGKVAAMEDGPKILGVAKISELVDDQDALRKAVDDTASAVANNPFKREPETVLA